MDPVKGNHRFDFQKASRAMTDSIQSSPHAGRLMRTLCREFGPRPPASAGMRRAQEFLEREWSALGARLHAEPVLFDGWQEGGTAVELIAPTRHRFDGIQAIHSRPGTVQAQLVDGGGLTFSDLQRLGDRARGSILLVNGNQITGGQFEPLQKRISLAEALGAVAVVVVGQPASLPQILFLNRARVPVTCVSGNTATTLRKVLAKKPVRLRLKTEGRTKRVTCRNVIGELGPRRTKETILACAHFDCFYLSPAAMDNTSGVVTMTEVARALAPFQKYFVRTLRFIAFTGEEYGYAGSKEYVRTHAAELDCIPFILSMDCMFESTAEGVAVMWAPKLRNYIAQGLRRSYPRVDVRNTFCMSSDYLPFMLAGVAAARPADWRNSFPPWTHTIEDTDEKVPARWLKANAAMCATILLRMLTDPKPLPTRRKSPEEVQKLVAQDAAAESLRWQVQLPS